MEQRQSAALLLGRQRRHADASADWALGTERGLAARGHRVALPLVALLIQIGPPLPQPPPIRSIAWRVVERNSVARTFTFARGLTRLIL